MPRAFPSQIDAYLASILPQNQTLFGVGDLQQNEGQLAEFLRQYDSLPEELFAALTHDERNTLSGAIGSIRFAIERRRQGANYDCLVPAGPALPKAWQLIKKMPDTIPSPGHDLSFITDTDLRDSIGTDITAVGLAVSNGDWKGATVFSGSGCEALLLYGLQEHERRTPGSIANAMQGLPGLKKGLKPTNLEEPSWDLASYTKVAEHINLISANTASALNAVRDFRNLIHPAKAKRTQAKFDRGTALIGAGVIEHAINEVRRNTP